MSLILTLYFREEQELAEFALQQSQERNSKQDFLFLKSSKILNLFLVWYFKVKSRLKL